jgi:CDP-diacylglycerol--glycerol-3-phosphate 3-phosphatidyltransferase
MYVLSSLIVLNAAGIAPIWFTFVVAFKFLEFTATNTVLKKVQRKGGVWIFDGFGRCFALLAFLSPGAFCLAELIPGVKHVVNFMLISVCIFAAASVTLRIARCIRCRDTKFSLQGLLHWQANVRQHQQHSRGHKKDNEVGV